MSRAIGIALFVLVGLGVSRFAAYYKSFNAKAEAEDNRYNASAPPAEVYDPGMPASLEPLLETAKAKGAGELKKWLDQYRGFVKEPRLSEIELDYVMAVGRSDPPEARRVFATIKSRNAEGSPVADRIAKLAKTYE